MRERITAIIERWFIQEPALFQILCTHDLVPNPQMACPVRSGKRRIEYNPDFIGEMTDKGLEEALRTEAVRILLKHPYERKPDGCSQQAISLGSNVVVGDNYHYAAFRIDRPADYGLPKGMAYEWYSRQIQSQLPPGAGGSDSAPDSGSGSGSDSDSDDSSERDGRFERSSDRNRDLSELWDEDDLTVAMINGVIESCTSWGSLAGTFAEHLKASTRAKINWRNVFSGFRASILSSKRKLTRMRPNRRTGFENMGSIRRFDTRLLVAIDVSGSISSESLSYFYGVVNSAFRYGFESIDVIQFDCGVRVVQNLHKVMREVVAIGRGGTSFQEPIDYAHENDYDGLLILTDGYAPEPVIPDNMRCKIIWVCQDKGCYEHNRHWMEKSGRVCTIELQ
jgi:predicted metal-dependent peptidase